LEDDNRHYPDCSYPWMLQRILEYYPDIPGKCCRRRLDTDNKDEDYRKQHKSPQWLLWKLEVGSLKLFKNSRHSGSHSTRLLIYCMSKLAYIGRRRITIT
ncbi:hypothetical protein Tco_1241405, partial [Tanacetum coccineum]